MQRVVDWLQSGVIGPVLSESGMETIQPGQGVAQRSAWAI